MTVPKSGAGLSLPLAQTGSDSSLNDRLASTQTPENRAIKSNPRLQPPRSLPPWIDSYEKKYGPASAEQLRLLQPPTRIVHHQSNFSPAEPRRRVSKDGFISWDDSHSDAAHEHRSRIPHFIRYGRASMRGRKWDHLRSAEPVIVSSYKPKPPQGSVTWQDFLRSSAWGRRADEDSHIVDFETLNKMQPTFDQDIRVQFHHSVERAKRYRRTTAFTKPLVNRIMRHPLSPLLFRLGVMITSILALGIAARIYQLEDDVSIDDAERTQSVVAIVVDCVAIPYIGYMIWDEYTGKPVGLRSAMSKISLILLDLFFIMFKSASTALAFESFIYHIVGQASLLHLSKALAAFQLLGLVSWSMTFTVNIFRTVKRLGGGGDDNDELKV